MCDQTARVLQTRRCMGFRTLFRAACVPKPGKEMLRKWFGLSTIERRRAVGELPLFGRTGEGGTKVSRCLRCLFEKPEHRVSPYLDLPDPKEVMHVAPAQPFRGR